MILVILMRELLVSDDSYARIDGWSVGIVANNREVFKSAKGEMQFGGVIYSDSADKAARFIMNCNQRKIPLIFLHDVVRKIEDNNIPASLVLNLDQTPSKYIQSSRYTMEKEGTKSIPIFGSSDKRSITATFVITLHGSFLPMQLIYGGKTSKSLPSVEFPDGFSLSANINHYSNSEESIKVIKEIVIPYVEKSRKNLNLATNFPALLIMDVFRGQMTTAVLNLLKANNILLVKVPNNMTHIFQPLDLTVNSWAKDFMREKFATWYAGKIKENLDKGEQLENIDIKTPLSVMKPLHATWLIELDRIDHLMH